MYGGGEILLGDVHTCHGPPDRHRYILYFGRDPLIAGILVPCIRESLFRNGESLHYSPQSQLIQPTIQIHIMQQQNSRHDLPQDQGSVERQFLLLLGMSLPIFNTQSDSVSVPAWLPYL